MKKTANFNPHLAHAHVHTLKYKEAYRGGRARTTVCLLSYLESKSIYVGV